MKKFIAILLSLVFIVPTVSHSDEIRSKEMFSFDIKKYNDYAYITSEDCKYLYNAGCPILPYYTKLYTFPLGTKIRRIEVKVEGIEKMKLNKKIAFIEDKERVHELKDFYPENWFSYKARVGIKNGEHVIFLSLHLYPARYNASRNEILYVRNFDIKVEYEVAPESLFSKDEYDLLVIAPDKWVKDLEPLKTHEEREGIKTIVVGLSEIYSSKYFPTNGRDDAEKLKYFIKNAIEQWGIEYVLLVGGRKYTGAWIIPVRYAYAVDAVPPFTERRFISDLYFADIYKYEDGVAFDDWDSNGNGIFAEYNNGGRYDSVDLMPDVYVGRLACRNKLELKILVNKIIKYENSQNKRILLCGGDTDLYDADDINEGEYLNERIAEIMHDFECIMLKASDGTLSRVNIWREIMKGVSFIDFSGHGSPNSWANHPHNSEEWVGITIFDIPFYFNGYKLPIIFANACHTAQFNLTYECIGWHFVRKYGGGAIAFIGSTGLSYGFGGYKTAESLSGYLEIEFFKNYYNSSYLCQMFYNALANYLNNIPMDDWQDYKTVEEYVLLGIPCLKIHL